MCWNSRPDIIFGYDERLSDSVDEGIVSSGCPSAAFFHLIIYYFVRSSFFPNRSCYHDISWTAWAISLKRTGNILQLLVMTCLDSSGQRSRSQQAVEVVQASTSTSWGVGVCLVFIAVTKCWLLAARGQEADTQDGMSQGHRGARCTVLAKHHRTRDQGDTAWNENSPLEFLNTNENFSYFMNY